MQQINRDFLELIDEHQKIDPYELRRIFTEAIREWEMNKGWNEGSRGDPWTMNFVLSCQTRPLRKTALRRAGFRAGIRGCGANLPLGREQRSANPPKGSSGRCFHPASQASRQTTWLAHEKSSGGNLRYRIAISPERFWFCLDRTKFEGGPSGGNATCESPMFQQESMRYPAVWKM